MYTCRVASLFSVSTVPFCVFLAVLCLNVDWYFVLSVSQWRNRSAVSTAVVLCWAEVVSAQCFQARGSLMDCRSDSHLRHSILYVYQINDIVVGLFSLVWQLCFHGVEMNLLWLRGQCCNMMSTKCLCPFCPSRLPSNRFPVTEFSSGPDWWVRVIFIIQQFNSVYCDIKLSREQFQL